MTYFSFHIINELLIFANLKTEVHLEMPLKWLLNYFLFLFGTSCKTSFSAYLKHSDLFLLFGA